MSELKYTSVSVTLVYKPKCFFAASLSLVVWQLNILETQMANLPLIS